MVHSADSMIVGPGRLDRRTLELVRSVLASYPEVTSATIFGSRALGSAHVASDIDIAVDGVESRLQGERIRRELDDLPLPYRFDVVSLRAIEDPDLLEHIDRFGLRIVGSDS